MVCFKLSFNMHSAVTGGRQHSLSAMSAKPSLDLPSVQKLSQISLTPPLDGMFEAAQQLVFYS